MAQLTEQDAAQILAPKDPLHAEFIGNVQDIIYGTDNVSQSIQLLKQLFEAYEKENHED